MQTRPAPESAQPGEVVGFVVSVEGARPARPGDQRQLAIVLAALAELGLRLEPVVFRHGQRGRPPKRRDRPRPVPIVEETPT